MKKLISFIALGLLSSTLFADVKLQSLFSDGMVLQQKKSVNIWGTSDSGEKVSIKGSWGALAETVATKDGEWKTQLKTPSAGGPFTITVKGKNTITLKNVMAGEVWLCTGQSNMDCSMSYFKDTKEAIAKSNYPDIRFFIVGKKWPNTPSKTIGGKWTSCTPKTTAGFSATGYFFGLSLYKELKVPIGLIACAFGGTRVEAWIPWEKQKNNKRLIAERERAAIQMKTYDAAKVIATYKEDMKKYKSEFEAWKNSDKKEKKPRRPKFKKNPVLHPNYSSSLYNGMIHPLAPYTIKGAIWYQGESNAGLPKEYGDQLELMIESWRERWGQGDFSFYFVQLPGYQQPWKVPVQENSSWAILREQFANVAANVPNTGMAITIDIGKAGTVHPPQKSKVGERLAKLAFHYDYGKNDVIWTGPFMKTCEFKDGKAIIKFETGGSPLATRNNEKLKGFAFCTPSGAFIEADAQITDTDTVEVTSENIKQPTIVYYAWAQNPKGVNLINKEGLPASPFRFGKKQ